MKMTGIGIIKRTLPDGRVHAFWYSRAERKAMGEVKFKKLLKIWEDETLKREEIELADRIREKLKKQEDKK